MLAKKNRLTKKEFDSVFTTGKRYHLPILQVIHQKDDTFRAAVVVGKKVYKKAVQRNKLRRKIYFFIQNQHKEKKLSGSFIIIARAPIVNISSSELDQTLQDILQQTQVV